MDLKDAVKHAKSTIIDLFADEDVDEIGLEEVAFDEALGRWRVTIGFRRPWMKAPQGALGNLLNSGPRRWYKVVEINNSDGRLISVTDRRLEAAE